MKNNVSAFRKPFLWIIMLALGIAAALCSFAVPDYGFENISGYSFVSPDFMCESSGGDYAVVDNGKVVSKISGSGDLQFVITPADLPSYGNINFCEAAFDAGGNLYVSAYVVSPDAYLTDMDVVLAFDGKGSFVREMLRYDYRNDKNQPRRTSRIYGLAADNDGLSFIYTTGYGSFQYKKTSFGSSDVTSAAEYVRDDYAALFKANYIGGGEYILSLTNGEAGILDSSGEYTELINIGYDSLDYDNGFVPVDAAVYKDEYYFFDLMSMCICKVGDDIEYVYDYTDFDPDDEDEAVTAVYGLNNKIAAELENRIFIIDGDNKYEFTKEFALPTGVVICGIIRRFVPWVSVVLSAAGLVLLFGWLMKWHLSLLSKQLLVTIPVIVAAFAVVAVNVYFDTLDSFRESLSSSMTAISELSVKALDGDEIKQMTSSECVVDGSLLELHNKLSNLVGYNKGDWNKSVELSVYINPDGEMLQSLASSRSYELPFLWAITSDDDNEEDGSRIIYVETVAGTEIDVQTPIFDSENRYVGIVRATVDMNTLKEAALYEIIDLGIKIFICMPFLIAAIAVLSVVSTGYLKKTKNAVAKIAEGDFSARIEKSPKDEIGEICTGVNTMAEQLEEYFSEMDRHEKFYYKFVPEKFRELLHKEELTDLALGDAESADLTVLFCDIRSFSLNSEMMTARENFEFVNVIYGKAGPIIRRHNGFVDKYIGDAVMALFEKADDAVEAGIELYREIVLNKATAEELKVSSINIGIGIHSGMARIGIVGEDERMSGTVISNTVNLSSRLESLTKKYAAAMIISKDTLDRMADPDRLNTRYLGMVQVAGVNEVKALYEVLDCLDEERKAERSVSKNDFREAVKLFHLGDLSGSLEMFRKLKSAAVNDPALDIYIDSISEKLENGDFEHNVFRFSRK